MRSMSGGRRTVAAMAAASVVLGTGATASAAPPPEPQLRLVAATGAVTAVRYEEGGIYLDLGTHFVAGRNPVEFRLNRSAYRNPIVATQVVRNGNSSRTVRLPAGLVTSFTGFSAFTHLNIKDSTGASVLDVDQSFCPNGRTARTRPDAPDRSPYPLSCPHNPFTVGSVWGLQAGWSKPTSDGRYAGSVDLAVGSYTATVSVNQPYRDLFGIPAAQSSVTVALTVRQDEGKPGDPGRPPHAAAGGAAAKPSLLGTPAATRAAPPQPAASRPTGRASVPSGPKPDLRSLPAFGVRIFDPQEGGHGRAHPGTPAAGDHLSFGANVWVAGGSPLVVDGFRRPGGDVMDAYQYFYDAKGKQIGHAQVGTMEYDRRDGHDHWHFTDFAQYRLLDASKRVAVRSGKEAFCLLSTDQVDLTLPGANWQPDDSDLRTACGETTALSVRQVLDLGSGDTYHQNLPGQSFDISDLPNGTYYIEVTANPDKNLHESRTDNNTSLREVVLGGTPGARTVQVPPHEGIVG